MNGTHVRKIVILVSCCVVAIAAVIVACLSVISVDRTPVASVVPTPTPAVAIETPAPTPIPTQNPHEGKVKSLLTGEYISKKKAKQRPFAVMINNIGYANLRQEGTSQMDILYEALAEGGITRMMGVFQGTDKVKNVGSIRSARHYYVSFASEWDAIFCHFGHTKYALSKIDKLGTDNLSGLSGIGGVVYRRVPGHVAPHNVFATGKKMLKGAKKLGYRTKIDEEKVAEHFEFYEEDTDLAGGSAAKYVKIPFSAYSTTTLKYDSKTKEYKKFEYGTKHKDHLNNKHLSFKNVIIQIVREDNIDRNGYQQLYLNEGGNGYYLTNGKRMKISWKKSEKEGTMTYYDKDGNVLTINPGKTYIAAYPKNRRKLISFKKKK